MTGTKGGGFKMGNILSSQFITQAKAHSLFLWPPYFKKLCCTYKHYQIHSPLPKQFQREQLPACRASALPTEQPDHRDKPGLTKYIQWYRSHCVQHKSIETRQNPPEYGINY